MLVDQPAGKKTPNDHLSKYSKKAKKNNRSALWFIILEFQ